MRCSVGVCQSYVLITVGLLFLDMDVLILLATVTFAWALRG